MKQRRQNVRIKPLSEFQSENRCVVSVDVPTEHMFRITAPYRRLVIDVPADTYEKRGITTRFYANVDGERREVFMIENNTCPITQLM